jgi:hypothetical protein
MHMVKSAVVRAAITLYLAPRPASVGEVEQLNKMTVPMRRYAQASRARCPGAAWIGCCVKVWI